MQVKLREGSIYIFLALICLSCQQSPPFWGGNTRYTVNVNINYNPGVAWKFTYYYDWNLKAERYEHDADQASDVCGLADTPFSKDGQTCIVTAARDGWTYIQFQRQNFCCKCTNMFGAIRYDWLQTDSHYEGIETIGRVTVAHWTKMGNSLNHYYCTIDKSFPVRAFQVRNKVVKYWDFDLSSYTTGPIDPEKFEPPCTNLCEGNCRLI